MSERRIVFRDPECNKVSSQFLLVFFFFSPKSREPGENSSMHRSIAFRLSILKALRRKPIRSYNVKSRDQTYDQSTQEDSYMRGQGCLFEFLKIAPKRYIEMYQITDLEQ